MIQTVEQVKKYLDEKLGECESWDQFNKSIKLVTTKSEYQNCRKQDFAIINETVKVVKEYLDTEFKKYQDIKSLPVLLIDLLAEKTQGGLGAAKKGVGQR